MTSGTLVTAPPPLYTAEELDALFYDEHVELIDGRIVELPMAGAQHGAVIADFALEAGLFVRQHRLGRCFASETRFRISRNPDTVLGPDWSFVAADRLPPVLPAGYLPLAPDLVLEVRSPSDTSPGVRAKAARWLAGGTRLVWDLDPVREVVIIYRPGMEPQEAGVEDVLDGGDVLPGFTLPLRRLFRPDLDA